VKKGFEFFMTTRRIPGWVIALILLPPSFLFISCSWFDNTAKEEYYLREKSLSLIDEGDRFRDSGRTRLALDRYNRAALIYSSPRAFYEMGRVFETEERDDHAATAYQEALNLAPDFKEARIAMLALGYLPEGYEPTESDQLLVESWKKARQVRPQVKDTAEPGVEEKPMTEAERDALLVEISEAAAARRMPTEAEVVNVLFSPRSEHIELPEADSPIFPQDVDIILGTYPYHYRKAQQLKRREQYDKAATEYERAMRADPAQMDARLDLGDMLMKIERYSQARFHYEQCLEQFSESPRPYLKLGNYFLTLDRREEARQFYRKSLEKNPDYVESYNNLAVMAMQQGSYDEAGEILQSILEIDPDYANAHLNLGIIASDIEKNREKAIKHFGHYIELDGARSPAVRRWISDLEDEEN
jgi:tetratricopeptide (TPR) repeat protein